MVPSVLGCTANIDAVKPQPFASIGNRTRTSSCVKRQYAFTSPTKSDVLLLSCSGSGGSGEDATEDALESDSPE